MNLKTIYPERSKDVRKGDFGYVLIVAGSKMYSGSPIFNAMSALRCGADLVTAVGHKRAMDIVANYAPDMITYPLDGEFCLRDIPEIIALSEKFDALVIGGGMERSKESFRAISNFIKEIDLPMVIDAEAIRAVAEDASVLKGKKVILVPNIPEFEILSGEKAAEGLEQRKIQTKELAGRLGAVIVLKGNVDIISDGENAILNETGTPLMSKGGFGDTLAGICGALLARGVEPLLSAEAACYINGKAGELAGEEYGESLIAGDIFDFFSKVIE